MATIGGDTVDEPDETFLVQLSLPANSNTSLGSPSLYTLTIQDDDAAPSVSISNASQAEGNTGGNAIPFQISLSAASGKLITVQYATSAGTATPGSDYTETAGTATFQPGQTTQMIAVSVSPDVTYELDETFTIALPTAVNATIATGQASGTILNDDALPSLSIVDVSQLEGNNGITNCFYCVLDGANQPARHRGL